MNTKTSKLIKELLFDAGLSESELARRSGVQQSTINRILNSEIRQPRITTLERIGAALGCTVDELLHGKIQTNDGGVNIPIISSLKDFYLFSTGAKYFQDKFLNCFKFQYPNNEIDLSHCFALNIDNKTMEPTIKAASIVIFLKTEGMPSNSSDICAIIYKEKLTVKRVFLQEFGGIVLRSDNPAYIDICIDERQAEELKIIGIAKFLITPL